jgi:DNA polymerase-3 subunit gamma/tau
VSLDTKYRPLRYSDVLGQEATIAVCKEYVRQGHGFRQSYVFAGGHGGGKTTLGRILARALLCEAPVEGEPCDQCLSCTSMLADKSEGFIEVDAATNSGKDHVRRITEEAQFGTYSGQRRLYLFDECFTEDTMLLTPAGPRSIRDLVEQRYDGLVASYQSYFEEVCWQPVTDWYEIHDERQCVTLEFDNGVVLTVTTDQELFTKNRGWVAASELTEDDDICETEIASLADR